MVGPGSLGYRDLVGRQGGTAGRGLALLVSRLSRW